MIIWLLLLSIVILHCLTCYGDESINCRDGQWCNLHDASHGWQFLAGTGCNIYPHHFQIQHHPLHDHNLDHHHHHYYDHDNRQWWCWHPECHFTSRAFTMSFSIWGEYIIILIIMTILIIVLIIVLIIMITLMIFIIISVLWQAGGLALRIFQLLLFPDSSGRWSTHPTTSLALSFSGNK